MREMEKMLHVIHAERKTDGSSNEDMECEISPDTPIAKITTVSTNSPADEAVPNFVRYAMFSSFCGTGILNYSIDCRVYKWKT